MWLQCLHTCKWAITIDGAGADDNTKRLDERNKGVILKGRAPFTDWINKINNTQIDNVKNLHDFLLMHNLIKYTDNYFKTSGNL